MRAKISRKVVLQSSFRRYWQQVIVYLSRSPLGQCLQGPNATPISDNAEAVKLWGEFSYRGTGVCELLSVGNSRKNNFRKIVSLLVPQHSFFFSLASTKKFRIDSLTKIDKAHS